MLEIQPTKVGFAGVAANSFARRQAAE